MKIAITSLYLPGSSKIGVGYQVHQFANRMTDRGHEVTVFSPAVPGEEARYTSVEVRNGRQLRTFRFAWNLRLQDFGAFDILHAHGDDSFLRTPSGIPHVRTVHGSCFSEARRIPGAKAKLRMGLLGVGEVLSTAVLADRAYGVSHATRRVYPWLDGVIPNGVEVKATLERSPTPDPTILFVGTYENRKRGRLLMEQFASTVRPRWPKARLLMVCSTRPKRPVSRFSDGCRTRGFKSSTGAHGCSVFRAATRDSGFRTWKQWPTVARWSRPRIPGHWEVLANGRYGVVTRPENLGLTLLDVIGDPQRRLPSWRSWVEPEPSATRGTTSSASTKMSTRGC